jgi:hypothetical protein
MNDYNDMERLLSLLAETQEMQLEPDALSELLSESMPEEIPASDMELISAAGSSEFAEFMKLAEENGTFEKGDE